MAGGLVGFLMWLFGFDYVTAQIVAASLVTSLFALVAVAVLYPRPKPRRETGEQRQAAGEEPRVVDLTARREAVATIRDALAAETARMLEAALKRGVVQPLLTSPECPPGSRVLLDPVNREIVCVDAGAERGSKIAGGARVRVEVEEEPERGEGEEEVGEDWG